jgi:DNA-binding CsgD family transcriptional regulator
MEGLTERETELLRLLAEGLSDKEIAARLCVAPGTVRTHVAHMKAKAGVTTRVGLVLWARDRGLI